MGKLEQFTSAVDSIVRDWPRESRRAVDLLDDALSQVGRGGVSMASLPPSWAFAVTIACTWRKDLIGSAVSTGSTNRELAESIGAIRPQIAIHVADDRRFGTDSRSLGSIHGVKLAITDLKRDERACPRYDDCDAWIAGTSGSTGSPKHALFTQSAIVANASATLEMQEVTNESVACLFTPTHFGYALNQTVSYLLGGATLTYWSDGLASPRSFRELLGRNRVTHISANPTSFRLLLRGANGWTHEAMRAVVSGGQPLDRKLANHIRDAFPRAAIYSGYGITENVNRVSFKRYDVHDDLDFKVALVGKSIAGTNVTLLDSQGHRLSIPRQRAEIIISGTSLMRRYLGDAPSQDISEFATGDLAEFDENGDLYIVGRKKTAINVGNEMVLPEEVEAVTLEVPGVIDCAVAGVADEMLGEAVVALIEVDDPQTEVQLSEDLLKAWRTGLSRAKRPVKHWIVQLGTIPRTSYGKIDRIRLAQMAEGLQ